MNARNRPNPSRAPRARCGAVWGRVLACLGLVLVACGAKNYLAVLVNGTALCPYLCPAVFPGELHFAFPWLEPLHEALTWLLERTQGLADGLFLDPWNLASLLLLAPVLEEALFRGPLYLLWGRMPAPLWWGLGALFALAFALSHGRHGVALVPLFVLGVCGLWLIANSGRFWPAIALHWLHNFFFSSLLIYQSLMLGD